MSKVYSVGITDFSSFLLLEIANAAFWFDVQNSNFVTSSFYEDSINNGSKISIIKSLLILTFQKLGNNL
jgi:hypothetical protein